MLEFAKDALNAINAFKDCLLCFFIDGGLPVVIAEEPSVSQWQPVAEQDTRKSQTFMWTLNGNEKDVCLAGDFNKWKPEPMTKCKNGFHATVKLEPGVYCYKFVVDGLWKLDPSAKGSGRNDFGTIDSVLIVD